ncbi:MAG: hypothetical protein WKF61_12995 [Luteimonas sp.]
MRRVALSGSIALTTLLCATACSKPQPPPADQPPEPQAQHTELRDAIQQPIDQAKSVEKAMQDAADKQQAEIDAKTGG